MKQALKALCLLLLSAGIAILGGCSKDDPETTGKIELPAGTGSIAFAQGAALSQSLRFTASSDWNVTLEETTKAAPDWVSVSPLSGKAGSNTLSITLSGKNTSGKERSATLSIRPAGGDPATLTVTQAPEAAPEPVTILPNKLTSLTLTEPGDAPVTSLLTYDAQGRLSALGDYRINYTTAGKVGITVNNTFAPGHSYEAQYEITLSDGRASALNGWDRETDAGAGIDDKEKFAYTLEYDDNGNVSRLSNTKPLPYAIVYSWGADGIVSMEIPGLKAQCTYGDQPNNLNIDLWSFISTLMIGKDDFPRQLNLAGNRCAKLPSRIAMSEEGSTGSGEFTYTVDSAGYITRIDIVYTDLSGDKSSIVLELAYEA